MIKRTSGTSLESLSEKHSNWLEELTQHSRVCQLCWSISEESSAHRLARLD